MNQECSNHETDTSAENQLEEPENACLRRELGLRPAYYSDLSTSDREIHPDKRPCPSWCWVGQHPEYGHEVDYMHPMEAGHRLEANPTVVASLYEGQPAIGKNDRFVAASTIEPRLEQLGQAAPIINVGMRRYVGREQQYQDEFLRLTITDAREFVTALNYLIRTAEAG